MTAEPAENSIPELLYSIGKVAEHLNVSKSSLLKWEKEGQIPTPRRIRRGRLELRGYSQADMEQIQARIETIRREPGRLVFPANYPRRTGGRNQMTPELRARQMMEAARNFARRCRDKAGPLTLAQIRMVSPPATAEKVIHDAYEQALKDHMSMAMECYLTGMAETLKLLNGNTEPEQPLGEEYSHEQRLNQLLTEYRMEGRSEPERD